MSLRRGLLLAPLAMLACEPAVEVDAIPELGPTDAGSDGSCFAVVDDELFPEVEVLSAIGDGSPDGGAWVLTRETIDNVSTMVMRRLPRPGEVPPQPMYDLEIDGVMSGQVELIPGAAPGQAYVFDHTVERLWLFDRDIGVATIGPGLADEPGIGPPDAWDRSLVFASGRPLLLITPRTYGDLGLVLYVSELDPFLDASGPLLELIFEDPYAQPPEELPPDQWWPDWDQTLIRVAAISRGQEGPAATIAIERTRELVNPDPGLTEPQDLDPVTTISLLRLRFDAAGLPQASTPALDLLFDKSHIAGPVRWDNVGLARDPFDVWLYAEDMFEPADKRLAAFDPVQDVTYGWTLSTELDDLQLLQLPAQAVLAARGRPDIDDQDAGDDFYIAADGKDGAFDVRLVHTLPGLAGYEQAGPGHVLLRRADAAPQLVWIGCDEAGVPDPD